VKPSEIYRRMKVQYGDICLSQGRVYGWMKILQNERQNVSEHRSGRPVRVATDAVKQQIEQDIRKVVDMWTKCIAKQGDYVEK
jgi:hypothetical protein